MVATPYLLQLRTRSRFRRQTSWPLGSFPSNKVLAQALTNTPRPFAYAAIFPATSGSTSIVFMIHACWCYMPF